MRRRENDGAHAGQGLKLLDFAVEDHVLFDAREVASAGEEVQRGQPVEQCAQPHREQTRCHGVHAPVEVSADFIRVVTHDFPHQCSVGSGLSPGKSSCHMLVEGIIGICSRTAGVFESRALVKQGLADNFVDRVSAVAGLPLEHAGDDASDDLLGHRTLFSSVRHGQRHLYAEHPACRRYTGGPPLWLPGFPAQRMRPPASHAVTRTRPSCSRARGLGPRCAAVRHAPGRPSRDRVPFGRGRRSSLCAIRVRRLAR